MITSRSVTIALFAATLWAQGDSETSGRFVDRVVFKFREGSAAVLEAGRFVSRNEVDLQPVQSLLDEAEVEVQSLVQLPWEQLDELWKRARAAQSATERPVEHLGLYYRAVLPAARAAALRAVLEEQPLIEHAYHEPIPRDPAAIPEDIPPVTPLFTDRQLYADAAPFGIDAPAARVIVGGRGRDVQIADMENRWNIPHEDLAELSDPDVWVTVPFVGDGNHGTAVVGEMVGDRNGYGVTGIADQADLRIASWSEGGVVNAITKAVAASDPGDIVLLEVQYEVSAGFVPAESFTADYNAIRTGTLIGVHVVEAAGNGSVNLDTLSIGGQPAGFLDPTSPNYRDSGAIVCGASDGLIRSRASFSNYGGRVDANGWGNSVVTTGYGTLFDVGDDRQDYVKSFSGTSSASPIVAGAVACLVGALRFQEGRELDPEEMRDLLRSTGTTVSGEIGSRPDLVQLLAATGYPDGLSLRQESVVPGAPFTLDLRGAPGDIQVVYYSSVLDRADLGLNRDWHLPLGLMRQVGAFVLAQNQLLAEVPIPADPSLQDQTFYLQSIRVDPALSELYLTNSVEIWVHEGG